MSKTTIFIILGVVVVLAVVLVVMSNQKAKKAQQDAQNAQMQALYSNQPGAGGPPKTKFIDFLSEVLPVIIQSTKKPTTPAPGTVIKA